MRVPQEPVAADIQGFVSNCIESIAQLETLLLLHGNPDQPWTPASVAERLYAKESDMQIVLADLCSRHLIVVKDGIYRFARQAPCAGTVDRLSKAYREQLVAVTNLIHAKQRRIL